MSWPRNLARVQPIGLFMLLFAISGCESRGPAPPNAFLSSTAARDAGARLYAAHCAICHGADGSGSVARQSFMVPRPGNLTVPPWSRRRDAGRTYAAIRAGVSRTAMAGWPALTTSQTWELVAYIESLGQRP